MALRTNKLTHWLGVGSEDTRLTVYGAHVQQRTVPAGDGRQPGRTKRNHKDDQSVCCREQPGSAAIGAAAAVAFHALYIDWPYCPYRAHHKRPHGDGNHRAIKQISQTGTREKECSGNANRQRKVHTLSCLTRQSTQTSPEIINNATTTTTTTAKTAKAKTTSTTTTTKERKRSGKQQLLIPEWRDRQAGGGERTGKHFHLLVPLHTQFSNKRAKHCIRPREMCFLVKNNAIKGK